MAKTHETSPYDNPQPFQRNRVDRNGCKAGATTIEKDNSILRQKLRDIQRKPSISLPTSPNLSFSRITGCLPEPSAAWASFKHHSQLTTSKGSSPQKQRQKEVEHDNLIMQKKLHECYSAKQDSFKQQLGISSIDCNVLWQQRTSMYSPPLAAKTRQGSSRPSTAPAAASRAAHCSFVNSIQQADHAGSSSKSRQRVSSSSGVPKTLSVAQCAGCGCRSFFHADGVHLKPCPGCHQVFYCSETCRRVDQPSHSALCRYYATGKWTPAGTRPAADCWVVNRSMAVARQLLKQQHRQRSRSPCAAAAGAARPATAPGSTRQQHHNLLDGAHRSALLVAAAAATAAAAAADTYPGDILVPVDAAGHYPARDSLAVAEQLDLQGLKLVDDGDFNTTTTWNTTTTRNSDPADFPVQSHGTPKAHASHVHSTTAKGNSSSSSSRRCQQQQQQQSCAAAPSSNSECCWDQELAWQEQLEQQLAAVRLQEQQEEAAQQLLEMRANQGLDGPRPCLCSNGMEFVGGRGSQSGARGSRVQRQQQQLEEQ